MITITAYGIPGPQGSKRFVGTRGGRGVMVESSAKVKPWREAVKHAAREAMQSAGLSAPLDGPLVVGMWFTLPKPASAPKRRETFPDRKPDLSKLARSTEDALSDAGLWADDARVVGYDGLWKLYPLEGAHALPSPGCVIEVRELREWQIEVRELREWQIEVRELREWQSCKWGGA